MRRLRAAGMVILLGVPAIGPGRVASAQAGGQQSVILGQPPAPPPPNIFEKGFSFAAAGDLAGPQQPLSKRNAALEEIGRILRSADLAFGDLEGSVFDLQTFRGFEAPENGGGYLLYPPAVIADYRALGFKVLSRANNHAMDWGLDGFIETSRALDVARIMHAGGGITGAAARAPGILHTPKGTLALISVTSTFPPMDPAGNIGTPTEARGGLFTLRVQQILLVTNAEMELIRNVGARQNLEGDPVYDARQMMVGGLQGSPPNLGGMVFRPSETTGQTWEVNETDRKAVLTAVSEARKAAGFVVFSIHAHERKADGSPADFLQPLFHDVIDAGADVVVRHGPRLLGGVEIYKGKPIFYGLGAFFSPAAATTRFEEDGFAGTPSSRVAYQLPPDWNDAAVAVSRFRDGHVETIRIHPLTLVTAGAAAGQPRLAAGEAAQKILGRVRSESAPYGTAVSIEDNAGVINISGEPR